MLSEAEVLKQLTLSLGDYMAEEPLLGPEDGDIILRNRQLSIIIKSIFFVKPGVPMGIADLDWIIEQADAARYKVKLILQASTIEYVLITNMTLTPDVIQELAEHGIHVFCTSNEMHRFIERILRELADLNTTNNLIKFWNSYNIQRVISARSEAEGFRLLLELSNGLVSEAVSLPIEHVKSILAVNGLHHQESDPQQLYGFLTMFMEEELRRRELRKDIAVLSRRAERVLVQLITNHLPAEEVQTAERVKSTISELEETVSQASGGTELESRILSLQRELHRVEEALEVSRNHFRTQMEPDIQTSQGTLQKQAVHEHGLFIGVLVVAAIVALVSTPLVPVIIGHYTLKFDLKFDLLTAGLPLVIFVVSTVVRAAYAKKRR